MTDDELRAEGQKFIDNQRLSTEAHGKHLGWSAEVLQERNAWWDYVDPLRLAVYVRAKDGAFVIDHVAIRRVCVNTAAFKQAPPKDSARINEPVVTGSAEDDRDTLADF